MFSVNSCSPFTQFLRTRYLGGSRAEVEGAALGRSSIGREVCSVVNTEILPAVEREKEEAVLRLISTRDRVGGTLAYSARDSRSR